MSGAVSLAPEGDIAVLTANNPPVNALSAAVRKGLVEGVRRAAEDDAVRAVVLICEGRTFFAGADISEFGKPPEEPLLPEVVEAFEKAEKPIVAAIHGTALGGGLEVALGCHWRVAVPSAKLGLPEVKLGLIPGAGGTQRLPRLVGVERALEMITSGKPVGAKAALDMGLVDELAPENGLREAAIAFARRVVEERQPLRRVRELTATAEPAEFDEFARANARKFRGFEAPAAAMQAVKAAVEQSFEEGLATERRLFMHLLDGEQSRAQRYYFFAERAAAKVEGLPEGVEPLSLESVGIVGAGTMGGGIAMNFLSAGMPVTIVEVAQGALDRGVATMRKNYEATAAKGRMTSDQVERAIGLLTPTLELERLAQCDLVVEAVFEDMGVKKELFGKLDRIAKPGAILATNTSYLDVNEIAAATGRPGHVLGLHFFSPANVMRLLEVVRGDRTEPQVLATAMALAKRIGKVAVVAGVCHGFIGNRMLKARQDQARALVLEGAMPWDVDRVLTGFGLPMGPFQMADLAGLDIGWSKDKPTGDPLRDRLCAMDRRGQKTGAGFYDYDEKRRGTPSPLVEQMVLDVSREAGVERRTIGDEEILERCLLPMVDEGARILEEGIAQRASDIDVVWVNGYGWPVYRGGPMFWADSLGARHVVERLRAYGFEPAGRLVQAAERGERLIA